TAVGEARAQHDRYLPHHLRASYIRVGIVVADILSGVQLVDQIQIMLVPNFFKLSAHEQFVGLSRHPWSFQTAARSFLALIPPPTRGRRRYADRRGERRVPRPEVRP